MHRLTLILSDLYLQEESAPGPDLPSLAMPDLDRLLRFSTTREFTGDWRESLAGGATPPAPIAAQGLAAQGSMDASLAAQCWFATPVFLDLHINHVRLNPRGLLRLAPVEGAAWCAAFAKDFGPDLALHDAGPRGFLLTGLPPRAVRSVDPARLLGGDVVSGFRQAGDPARADLARTATEIEFWLHTAPLNTAREHARRPRITSLWLWGGGIPADRPVQLPAADLFGEDAFLAGLAHAAGRPIAPAPAGFAELPDVDAAIVELAPMSGGAGESLAQLESRWFAPVSAALAGGALKEFELRANDRRWCTRRGAGWRFWRPRRAWLQSLASPPVMTKA